MSYSLAKGLSWLRIGCCAHRQDIRGQSSMPVGTRIIVQKLCTLLDSDALYCTGVYCISLMYWIRLNSSVL